MPVWQAMLDAPRKAGKINVLAVVQEQHPDRARLYRQWRQLDWPIAVDALNLLGHRVVPILAALDENGREVARLRGPEDLAAFLARPPAAPADDLPPPMPAPDLERLEALAQSASGGEAWRDLGDARFLAGHASAAVEAYAQAVRLSPKDALARFRYGVALRRRAESSGARAGDAQAAVAAWGEALAMRTDQYIWRRRLQQYGPRLDKPYNFYSWIAQARADIRARGEDPIRLSAEPAGSEIAAPRKGPAGDAPALANPDPDGKLPRDAGLIRLEVMVTPARVQPGKRVRVRLRLRPDARRAPYWNNEGDGLRAWVGAKDGVVVEEHALVHTPGAREGKGVEAETREPRLLECELAIPAGATGTITLPGYALYDVCEDKSGVCRRLRQDFTVTITVDPDAPALE